MAKDFVTPILLGLTMVLFIVAAATPFTQMSGDGFSTKFSLFQFCQTLGSASACEAMTPSREYGCANVKSMWLGGQATVLLTIFIAAFLAILGIARLGDKCMNFNGKALLVLHVLMLIFGLVCTCLVAALYWAPQCGTGVSYSQFYDIRFCLRLPRCRSLLVSSV